MVLEMLHEHLWRGSSFTSRGVVVGMTVRGGVVDGL